MNSAAQAAHWIPWLSISIQLLCIVWHQKLCKSNFSPPPPSRDARPFMCRPRNEIPNWTTRDDRDKSSFTIEGNERTWKKSIRVNSHDDIWTIEYADVLRTSQVKVCYYILTVVVLCLVIHAKDMITAQSVYLYRRKSAICYCNHMGRNLTPVPYFHLFIHCCCACGCQRLLISITKWICSIEFYKKETNLLSMHVFSSPHSRLIRPEGICNF